VGDEPAYVVLLRVHLTFPDVGSLKGKRSELSAIKALLRDRMGGSVAEVGHQDAWQRSTLAVAFAAGSVSRCDQAADEVQRALDARLPQGARVERRVASWGDLEDVG
jgi:uncharacterized protein YlxP (DUF503 family)